MKAIFLFLAITIITKDAHKKMSSKFEYTFKRLKLQQSSRGKTILYSDNTKLTEIFNHYQQLKNEFHAKNSDSSGLVEADDGSNNQEGVSSFSCTILDLLFGFSSSNSFRNLSDLILSMFTLFKLKFTIELSNTWAHILAILVLVSKVHGKVL